MAWAATIYLFHLSPSENLDYDRQEAEEEEEPLASGGTGFRDEHSAPDANFYAVPEFGTSDALESGYPVAWPSATSSGSAAIDTPPLTVQCSKDSFQIALHAGRLSDVHVKGMCQGAAVCKSSLSK